MKKFLFLLIFSLLVVSPSFSQEMPADVPEGHYAYDSIFDLVERGVNVSQGYPDGTFRGSKLTNRYETAYLMATLAISLRDVGAPEMDLSDIREEIEYLRKELKELQGQPELRRDLEYFGSVEMRSGYCSVLAYDPTLRRRYGPESNYRFKYSIVKVLGGDSNLRINLDTMDGGFNSGTLRSFPLKLLDIEGNFSTDVGLENPLYFKVLMGPGTVYHRDTSGIIPSDDYLAYSRPKPTFIVGSVFDGLDVSGGYVARGISNFGAVSTHEVNLTLKKQIDEVPLIGKAEVASITRYVFSDFRDYKAMPNDARQELSFKRSLSAKQTETLAFGISTGDRPNGNYYLGYKLDSKDINESGTDLLFFINSIGDSYRLPFEELEFLPLNMFDKKMFDGTVDIGIEFARPISKATVIKSRSNWVADSRWKMGPDVPGSSYTHELSVDHRIFKDLSLYIYYRYYQVPSRINQYMVAVPEVSDVFGINLLYQF